MNSVKAVELFPACSARKPHDRPKNASFQPSNRGWKRRFPLQSAKMGIFSLKAGTVDFPSRGPICLRLRAWELAIANGVPEVGNRPKALANQFQSVEQMPIFGLLNSF